MRPQDNFSGKIGDVDDIDDDFEVEISDLHDAGGRDSLQKGLLYAKTLVSRGRKHSRGLLVLALALLIVVVIFPALLRFLAPNVSMQVPVTDSTFSLSFQPFSIGAVTNGVTYAVGPDQSLHALNTLDGTQLWQERFPFYTANPQNSYVYMDDGFAYQVLQQNQIQVAQESRVQVLQLSNHRPLWRSDEAPPGNWPLLLDRGAIVSSRFIWVGNSISAINVSDGSLLWQYHLSTNQGFNGIPLHDKLLVSIFPTAGRPTPLYMLRASDGSEIWHYADPHFSLLYAPTNTSSGLLYLSNSEGSIKALRMRDGSVAWQYTPTIPGPSSVAITDGTLYITTAIGELDAVNASDGSLLWHWNQANATRMVQVIDGIVFATTTDGEIYAIRARDGAQLWRFNSTSPLSEANKIMIWNGIIYVFGQVPLSRDQPALPNTAKSILYALRVSDGALLWKRIVGENFSSSGGFYFGGSFIDFVSALQVAHDILYLNVEPDRPGAMRASDGYVLWLTPHPASMLQMVDDIVYSTSSQSTLNAYRARDGAPLWHYPK